MTGMLTIRLQRTGRVNDPNFRVIVGDKRNSAKSGKFKEILGSYDPKAGKIEIKAENRSVDILRLSEDGSWKIFRSLNYPVVAPKK